MWTNLTTTISRWSLNRKLTLILGLVLVIAVAVSSILLWQVLQVQAEDKVATRGELMLGMVNSVRDYTSNHVRPLLAGTLNTETAFTPERVPAFSASTTFETMRQTTEYDDFHFKEASRNPSNPNNRADSFEEDLLAQFEADASLDELTGFRTRDGNRWFYIARPMTVGSESCLDCHGDPADAPPSLIATYGDENGFGWEVGQIIAAQVIYVPAGTVFDEARNSLILLLLVFVGISVGIILLLNFWLKPQIIRPVAAIAEVAEALGEGAEEAMACASGDLQTIMTRGDELGQLARAIQRSCQEIAAREEKLRQQVRDLRIEIDRTRQEEQVDEITGSDYFQDLQSRAKNLRRKRRGDAPAES